MDPRHRATQQSWDQEDERGIDDPVAAALLHADVGEVELVEQDDALVVSVRPRTVSEVSRVVTVSARLGGRIAVSRRFAPGMVALDLSALDTIEAPEERSGTIRVGAGATVRDVEARAIQSGLTLGPLLPSSRFKKVGAWLAGPTRGERAVPPGRLESAALALEAVLADGSLLQSRAAPRSAAGPDLDHLLLGGEGRFGILTAATLRLAPRALVEAAAAREASTLLHAIEALRKAMHSGLSPAEARWDRARRTVEVRFIGRHAARHARMFGEGAISGHEIRGHLELAGSWKSWAAASPLQAQSIQLVALHSDGAFGAVEFSDRAEAERAARFAQAIGFAVVSPRKLRAPPDTPWTGASDAWRRLASTLDPKGVFAPVAR